MTGTTFLDIGIFSFHAHAMGDVSIYCLTAITLAYLMLRDLRRNF
ncbi:hypothetical protein [Methylobacterium sp. CM6244]